MTVTDPVDARLLAALADMGKAAVHEIAARVGMDPKEVAYRLVGLSGSGLPLLVGVESDPNGLRAALSGPPSGHTPAQPAPGHGTGQPPRATPPESAQPPHAAANPHGSPRTPSGPYPSVQGTPSGPYPPVQGTPSGPYPPAQGTPSGPYQPPQAPPPPRQGAPPAPPMPTPPAPQGGQSAATGRATSTWGPPQTASWARDDQAGTPRSSTPPPGRAAARSGRIGDTLESSGLEGETLAIQLLEVQDPADFLFGAAGYSLGDNERAVVVHTEVTNRGNIPFVSLPDNYLELIAADGHSIAKDPMSLTSRPPHKIGVSPGETAGGHTLYVLPSDTRIVSVRWSPRPEQDERTRLWHIDD